MTLFIAHALKYLPISNCECLLVNYFKVELLLFVYRILSVLYLHQDRPLCKLFFCLELLFKNSQLHLYHWWDKLGSLFVHCLYTVI